MASLTQQRCLNHGAREAVARCPECRQYFCRECVAEHDDRLICAGCLKKLTTKTETKRWRLTGVIRFAQLCVSVMAIWLFFYLAGRSMLNLESYFHNNTLWTAELPDD